MTKEQIIIIIVSAFLAVVFKEIITGVIALVKKLPGHKIKGFLSTVFNRTVLTILVCLYQLGFFGWQLYILMVSTEPLRRIDVLYIVAVFSVILYWLHELITTIRKAIEGRLHRKLEELKEEKKVLEASIENSNLLISDKREVIRDLEESLRKHLPPKE